MTKLILVSMVFLIGCTSEVQVPEDTKEFSVTRNQEVNYSQLRDSNGDTFEQYKSK